MDEVLQIALSVEAIFERLEVRHVVGGSLASSLHGIPRATHDIDFIVDLSPSRAEALVGELTPGFYVDADAVREAIRDRSRFNAIHLDSMFKVDVYIPAMDASTVAQLERGEEYVVDPETGGSLIVASAEDTIVQKLRWYRMGDEVSKRQWRDALGILRVQGEALDFAYLSSAAQRLGLDELLDRALRASSEDPPA